MKVETVIPYDGYAVSQVPIDGMIHLFVYPIHAKVIKSDETYPAKTYCEYVVDEKCDIYDYIIDNKFNVLSLDGRIICSSNKSLYDALKFIPYYISNEVSDNRLLGYFAESDLCPYRYMHKPIQNNS